MQTITLHYLFRKIVNNDLFLLTIIDPIKQNKPKSTNKVNLIAAINTSVELLSLEDKIYFVDLPVNVQKFTNKNYFRYGIQTVIENELSNVNISFLNSLNHVLRPDLHKYSIENQLKDHKLFENFVTHKIARNCKIDKAKNTKKVQLLNKKIISDLTSGNITQELIQNLINIFEINLVIFDLHSDNILLYWTHGTKYPVFNMFKNIHFMCYNQGNYTPLIPINETTKKELTSIYVKILKNIKTIEFYPPMINGILSFFYLCHFNLSIKELKHIFDQMYPSKSRIEILNQAESIFK